MKTTERPSDHTMQGELSDFGTTPPNNRLPDSPRPEESDLQGESGEDDQTEVGITGALETPYQLSEAWLRWFQELREELSAIRLGGG